MMEKIGEKTIKAANGMVGDLLSLYQGKINRAFDAAEGELSVSFKISFCQANEKISVTCDIGFIESRVKDGVSDMIDEKQLQIFDE